MMDIKEGSVVYDRAGARGGQVTTMITWRVKDNITFVDKHSAITFNRGQHWHEVDKEGWDTVVLERKGITIRLDLKTVEKIFEGV